MEVSVRNTRVTFGLSLLITAVLVGCAPQATQTQPATTAAPSAAAPQRTLVISQRGEPPTLAARSLVTQGSSLNVPPRFFNATLDMYDVRQNPHPHLVEALPEFGTDS